MREVEELCIPTVVAITGNAIGGGVAVSLGQKSPIRVVTESSPSCHPLVRRSLNATERVIAQNGSAAFGNISRGAERLGQFRFFGVP